MYADVDPCEAEGCPRSACWRHGGAYLRTTPFASAFACQLCMPGLEDGTRGLAAQQPAAQSAPADPAGAMAPPSLFAPTGHPLHGIPFHATHHLAYHRGVAWCWTCGKWSSGSRRGVTQPCGPPTAAGLASRGHLLRGRTPLGTHAWPLPEGIGPPPGPLAAADGNPPAHLRVAHRGHLSRRR